MDKYDTLRKKKKIYNQTKTQLPINTCLGCNHNKDKHALELLEPLWPSTTERNLLIQWVFVFSPAYLHQSSASEQHSDLIPSRGSGGHPHLRRHQDCFSSCDNNSSVSKM